MPGGSAGLTLTSSLMLVGMFQRMVRQSAEFENQMTSVERILEYKELDSEAELEIPDKAPPDEWPTDGAITYSNVSFTYAGCSQPVLSNLNFSIAGGEKIGVVGRTGAGKSSLLASLFRMVEPEGTITIDGLDTKTMGLHDLRKKVCDTCCLIAGYLLANLRRRFQLFLKSRCCLRGPCDATSTRSRSTATKTCGRFSSRCNSRTRSSSCPGN